MVNSKVFKAIVSALNQQNASKPISQYLTVQMDNDNNPQLIKAKKLNILQWSNQSPDLNPFQHAINFSKNQRQKAPRTSRKWRQLQQMPGRGSAGKKPIIWWRLWVPHFRFSGVFLGVLQVLLKRRLIFDYDTLPTYYESLEPSIQGMKVVVKAGSLHLSVHSIFFGL